MGHLVGKELYRKLGEKVDGLTVRAPWSEALYAILKELYSARDAELIVKMPYSFAPLSRLTRITRVPNAELRRELDGLCSRGLAMDVRIQGRRYYAPSPFVIGIFELTMMRSAGVEYPKMAKLFRQYVEEGGFYGENWAEGQRVALVRALPHEGSVVPEDHVEVLDYEKATAIVERTARFAIGICSCRHEKHHLGERTCQVPLESCSVLGNIDFMVEQGFAREISRTEMLERIARSRELGLVLNADNVQRNVNFICHCCGCCCNLLAGITRHGYPNTVVTSSFLAAADARLCQGCGICSRRCPVGAVGRTADPDPRFRKHGRPEVDAKLCIGCGVCATRCRSGAMKLHPRKKRVLHPETTFERVLLQCLERGTLQNQIFDEPEKKSHAFLRALLGGFLRLPPVKQALMSDLLRSRFLTTMRQNAWRFGKGEFTDI